MAKFRKIFGSFFKKRKGVDMGLPAVLSTVALTARRVLPAILRGARRGGPAAVAGALIGRASAPGPFFGGRRKRARTSLSSNEMGKIMFLAQTLGKRNPAVTLIVMKALGGRL